MTGHFKYLMVFIIIKIIRGDLKACKYYGKTGVCIPADDCYGKAVKSSLTCGRNICCLDPSIVKQKCQDWEDYKRKNSNYPEKRNQSQYKIVGGQNAKGREFPHMAAIGFKRRMSKIDWVCGGALISPNFILSAAHCFIKKVSNTWALLGTSRVDQRGVRRRIVEIINHPKYTPWEYHSDVALLRLAAPLDLSSELHPACLLFESEQLWVTKATATGWGKTAKDEKKGVSELQKVELDIIPLGACKKYFPVFILYNVFVPSMMCAGHLAGGKDTCEGDSGGPLAIPLREVSHVYGIIGITSTGNYGCGEKDAPAIYTKVSYFVTWIASIVWRNETNIQGLMIG